MFIKRQLLSDKVRVVGNGFYVSHNLLNKWITVQLIFIDKLTVDYPCVLKLLTNNCGIYVVKLFVFLIERCKFLIGHINEVVKLHTVQAVLDNILQRIVLLSADNGIINLCFDTKINKVYISR